MRFLVDECTGPSVACWLREQGHDVFSVDDQACGIDDDKVITRAYQEDRILVTNDKDFGEKIYRDKKPHRGIVRLHLDDERTDNKLVDSTDFEIDAVPTFTPATAWRIGLSRRWRD